jgi:hypothetical protein
MAKYTVSGRTADEVAEMREEYEGDFDAQYCLAKIPHQPDDYDGPDRYCVNQKTCQIGDSWRCKFHGGKGEVNSQNLDTLGAMKHGMTAARDHLVEDFDEKDQALYDWITRHYPDAYDIDVESDPNAAYDLHRLAAEMVRAERGRGFLIDEGEVNEEPKYTEEGQLVVDENGEVVTEKSEHYLAQMMHRQDNKISKIQKQLGITRKEQGRQEAADDAVAAIKSFSELGSAFLNREGKDYDPDDEPWAEND